MRLFRLAADETMSAYRAEPKGLTESERLRILTDSMQRSMDRQEPIQLSIKEGTDLAYADFLEAPLPLVSDRLRRFLEKAMPELRWRAVILADQKSRRQEVYWLLAPPLLDCLSSKCERYVNGTMKRLVLNRRKVNKPLFQVEDLLEKYIFVNLMLAESLLRRDYIGISLKPVEQVEEME